MPQPNDYSGAFSNLPQPGEAMMDGFKNGLAIRQIQDKQQQQAAAAERARQMSVDLDELSRNPTTNAIGRASIKYPQLSEQFKRSFDMLEPAQKQAKLEHASQVYAAINSKNPDVAARLLTQQAAAARNSGNEADAKAAEMMAIMVRDHPEMAQTSAGLILASALGPDKFTAAYGGIGAEERADAQAPFDLEKKKAEAIEAKVKAGVAIGTADALKEKAKLDNANITSQIKDRAARLSLDQDRLTSEVQMKISEMQQKRGTLPDSAVKIVNDSSTAAVVADQSAAATLALAEKFTQLGGGNGLLAKGAEGWAQATGQQDAMSAARQEYARIRNAQAIKSLPPGPATDKDISLALKGFPVETADAEYIASFLRGMAKLQQREAVFETAKAEWVNAVGSLSKPKTDIDVDGIKIPAGTTFVDFSRQFLNDATEKRAAEQAAEAVQTRSYMRHAEPPPQNGATSDWETPPVLNPSQRPGRE